MQIYFSKGMDIFQHKCVSGLFDQPLEASLTNRTTDRSQYIFLAALFQDLADLVEYLVNSFSVDRQDFLVMSQGGVEAGITQEAFLQHQNGVQSLQFQTHFLETEVCKACVTEQ